MCVFALKLIDNANILCERSAIYHTRRNYGLPVSRTNNGLFGEQEKITVNFKIIWLAFKMFAVVRML